MLAKLLSYPGPRPPLAQIGADLVLSASEVHAALKRLTASKLIASELRDGQPLLAAVEEFLVHGVKYAFPARRGEVTRGMPTSWAAPPLGAEFDAGADLPPVWPSPDGVQRGVALEPLYRTAPIAAKRDPFLYEMLALLDALRDGRARERKIAERKLTERIHRHASAQS